MVLAAGVLAWRLVARRKAVAVVVAPTAEAAMAAMPPTIAAPLPAAAVPIFIDPPTPALPEPVLLAPLPLPEIDELVSDEERPTHQPSENAASEPHWTDRYLRPSAASTVPMGGLSTTADVVVQPSAEMLAPAAWMLGVEPMPLVEEPTAVLDSPPSIAVAANKQLLDMDSAPSVPLWAPPATAREAEVAEIPDEIELPTSNAEVTASAVPLASGPSEEASLALSLNGLLWQHEVDSPVIAPAANAWCEASIEPALADLPEVPEVAEDAVIADVEENEKPQLLAEADDEEDQEAAKAPIVLPIASTFVAPSLLTALGVRPIPSASAASPLLAAVEMSPIRGKTALPPQRPKSVKPVATAPAIPTAKFGLSAASKAIALSLPRTEPADKSVAQFSAPPPRIVPRAPVNAPQPQTSPPCRGSPTLPP